MGVTKIPQLPEPNHKALHKFITYFLDTLEQFQRHDFMKHNGQPCHPPSRYPLCPGSFPRLRALWLLPLLDRPGACEDSGIPLSWSSSGQFTHSLTKLRQQVSSVRFVWGVLFHLLFPETDKGEKLKLLMSTVEAQWGQRRRKEEKLVGGSFLHPLSCLCSSRL